MFMMRHKMLANIQPTHTSSSSPHLQLQPAVAHTKWLLCPLLRAEKHNSL
jgi:hypothetical protein